jgi:hypothetical protein
MTSGVLVSRNASRQRFNVRFDLRFSMSTKHHPIPGVPVGKLDVQLTIQSAGGSVIPDGDYDLRPEGSIYFYHVQKVGSDWTLILED